MIQLTTPEGKIALNVNTITAVCEIQPTPCQNNMVVSSQIYINNQEEPFNIIESYENILEKMGFEQQILK